MPFQPDDVSVNRAGKTNGARTLIEGTETAYETEEVPQEMRIERAMKKDIKTEMKYSSPKGMMQGLLHNHKFKKLKKSKKQDKK